VLLEELTLLDSLKHASAETTWYEKGNWAKMTWATKALKNAEAGMLYESFGTTSGSYWSVKEFKNQQAVSFVRSIGKDVFGRFWALWLCYNNTTHSGYRCLVEETESGCWIKVYKVESGVATELGFSFFFTPAAGDVFGFWKAGTKLEAWRKAGGVTWTQLVNCKDTGTAYTTGFIGLDGEGSDPNFSELLSAEKAEEAAPEVVNPGTQHKVISHSVQLELAGTNVVTYEATGLPPGLVINTTSGGITGIPTTLGAYAVTLTVKNNSGASATAAFTFNIGLSAFEPTKAGEVHIEAVKQSNGSLVDIVLKSGTRFESEDPNVVAVLENDFPGVVTRVE
jgi:hypothetical protein